MNNGAITFHPCKWNGKFCKPDAYNVYPRESSSFDVYKKALSIFGNATFANTREDAVALAKFYASEGESPVHIFGTRVLSNEEVSALMARA